MDSNILLPLLANGHPFRPGYEDAVARLEKAARSTGTHCQLLVASPFLNEVIAHRHLAIEMVRDLRLDDPNELWRHITYWGASNTNVFVGAFSNHVGRQNQKITFHQFLRKVAPYETERELETFLLRQRIECVHVSYEMRHSTEKAAIMTQLIQGYEESKKRQLEPKETVLMEHEAEQILLLQKDNMRRRRSIFVTADLQLEAVVRRQKAFSHLAGSTVSQFGFLGMVDIMVGLDADKRSLARMMWAAPRTDAQHQLRDYLIARVLKEYDAALTSAMHNVIDQIVAETAAAAKKEGIDLMNDDEVEDIARTAKFLDRYEEKFFQLMSEEMDNQTKRAK